jgi:hypothetical protein
MFSVGMRKLDLLLTRFDVFVRRCLPTLHSHVARLKTEAKIPAEVSTPRLCVKGGRPITNRRLTALFVFGAADHDEADDHNDKRPTHVACIAYWRCLTGHACA